MPNYRISWEESVWYDLEIEADSYDDALAKFSNSEYDVEDVQDVGQEIMPDTIECEEV